MMSDEEFEVESTDEKQNDPALEKEFLEAHEKATKLIDEQLDFAAKAINKAERISEKYGIPFSASVSPLGQSYTPESFEKKFGGLDLEELAENLKTDDLYDVYPGEYPGWEHSAVC